MINAENYQRIKAECDSKKVTLVAVSKMKPQEDIMELYELGHRDFGENYVQELIDKQAVLPKDIRWHFIGHLQTNKAKQIVPFVHLIHSIDSAKLLKEINSQATKINRKVKCLLQMHVAQEITKYGLDEMEITEILLEKEKFPNASIDGLMGMASLTENQEQIKDEFTRLKNVFAANFQEPAAILSIGMSSDYELAIQLGSNMIRIGSLLFGAR